MQPLPPWQSPSLRLVDEAGASGIEDRTGTLEVGKWADLTVLSLDPLTTPGDALLSGAVRMTVVDGVVRYEAEGR